RGAQPGPRAGAGAARAAAGGPARLRRTGAATLGVPVEGAGWRAGPDQQGPDRAGIRTPAVPPSRRVVPAAAGKPLRLPPGVRRPAYRRRAVALRGGGWFDPRRTQPARLADRRQPVSAGSGRRGEYRRHPPAGCGNAVDAMTVGWKTAQRFPPSAARTSL